MKLLLLYSPFFFLKTLFWNILSLCSSLSVGDQISHPYKTTSRIIETTSPTKQLL
jgi:hypothetical protein